MEAHVYGPVGNAVASAKLLGGLDSCTIWALLSLCLIAYVAWKTKRELDNNEKWRLIREKQIEGEAAQTEVLRQLTSQFLEMKMLLTKFIVKE